MPVRFAPEGGAVPGDRIIGILTPGEGITVYPIQSPVLTEFDDQPERWLDVRWDIDEEARERFPARISVATRQHRSAAAVAVQMGDCLPRSCGAVREAEAHELRGHDWFEEEKKRCPASTGS